jgi:hypothetical protein
MDASPERSAGNIRGRPGPLKIESSNPAVDVKKLEKL